MSLEQAIEANTAAIRELIAALGKKEAATMIVPSGTDGVYNVVPETRTEVPVKKSTPPAPVETVASSPVVVEPVTEPTAQETISAPLDYEKDVRPLLTVFFTKKCAGNRAPAEALLKKYGVAKFSEVTDLVALSSDLNAQVGA